MFRRTNLKSMASANRLHKGVNMRGHQVWAPYDYFETVNNSWYSPEDDLVDIIEFFSTQTDPNIFKERHALTQLNSESCPTTYSNRPYCRRFPRWIQSRSSSNRCRSCPLTEGISRNLVSDYPVSPSSNCYDYQEHRSSQRVESCSQ